MRALVCILLTALPFMSNSQSSSKHQTGHVSLSLLHMERNTTMFDLLPLGLAPPMCFYCVCQPEELQFWKFPKVFHSNDQCAHVK